MIRCFLTMLALGMVAPLASAEVTRFRITRAPVFHITSAPTEKTGDVQSPEKVAAPKAVTPVRQTIPTAPKPAFFPGRRRG